VSRILLDRKQISPAGAKRARKPDDSREDRALERKAGAAGFVPARAQTEGLSTGLISILKQRKCQWTGRATLPYLILSSPSSRHEEPRPASIPRFRVILAGPPGPSGILRDPPGSSRAHRSLTLNFAEAPGTGTRLNAPEKLPADCFLKMVRR